MNIKFTEIQRFTQWWIWILLIGISFIFVYGIYQQIIIGIAFGDKPMSNGGLITVSIGYFLFVTFFLSQKLITTIDREGIEYCYFSFVNERLKWNEIKKIEVVKYGFVGWGIRLRSEYGTIYNMKGNNGIAIELHNGKKLLIGTQRPDEVNDFLRNLNVL